METKPKFIYFDLDDTLLDHKKAEQQALRDVFHHFTVFGSTKVEALIEVYHQQNSKQWALYGRAEVDKKQLQRNRFELTLREMGLDDTRFAEIGAQYMHFYQDHWQWMEGAEAAYEAIRDRYPVGILTNGFAQTQEKKFKQFDLYNRSNHVVISEEVGVMKPNPAVFEYATNLTGYEPQDILYIGDSYTSDVMGGAGFGWNVAWFTQNAEAVKHPKADFIFSNFKELEKYIQV